MDSDSTAVSDIKHLFLDHQIREQVAEAFQKVARDTDAGVRQSVIIATGYFPHRGLIDFVRQLRDSDPVGHVRKNAEILLSGHSGGN
jgi:hypothetical protein